MRRMSCYLGALCLLLVPTYVQADSSTSPYFTSSDTTAITDNNKHIIKVYSKDFLLGNVQAYEYRDGMVLPLEEVAKLLGFPIKVDAKHGTANGWLLRDNQIIAIDQSSGKLIINGKETSFSQELIQTSDTEMYVDITLLADILPVRFAFDYMENKLFITPKSNLSAGDQNELIFRWGQVRTGPSSQESSATVTGEKLSPKPQIAPPTPAVPLTSNVAVAPQGKNSVLSDENLLSLQPILDSYSYDKNSVIDCYHIGDYYYLPLGSIMGLLDFAINVNSSTGIASGWAIKEDRKFALNTEKKNHYS